MENEKLQEMGVFHVESRGRPASDYRVYVDSADPDLVGSVIESMDDVIEEMETGEEVFQVTDRPKSKADFSADK